MIIWEPYTGTFTGQLTSLVTQSGHSFTLTKNTVRVTKGQPFMLELDIENNKVRFLPVIVPDWWVGLT